MNRVTLIRVPGSGLTYWNPHAITRMVFRLATTEGESTLKVAFSDDRVRDFYGKEAEEVHDLITRAAIIT